MYTVALLDEDNKAIKGTTYKTNDRWHAYEYAEDMYLHNIGRRSTEYRRWAVIEKGFKSPIADYEWDD